MFSGLDKEVCVFRDYEKSVKVSNVELVFIGIFRFLLVWFSLRIIVFVGESTLFATENLVAYRSYNL